DLGHYGAFFKNNRSCDVYGTIMMWNDAAKRVGFKYKAGQHLVLFFAEGFETSDCDYGVSGMAEVGWSPEGSGALWVSGTDSLRAKGTLAHELGHNFGLQHANVARCLS